MKHLLLILSLFAGLNIMAQTSSTSTPAEAPQSSGAPEGVEDSFNYPAAAPATSTQGSITEPGVPRCATCEALQKKKKLLLSDAHRSSRLSARGRQAVEAGAGTTPKPPTNTGTDSTTEVNKSK